MRKSQVFLILTLLALSIICTSGCDNPFDRRSESEKAVDEMFDAAEDAVDDIINDDAVEELVNTTTKIVDRTEELVEDISKKTTDFFRKLF